MEINTQMLEQLRALDDRGLSEAIRKVAGALGADEKTTRKFASDPGKIRKKLNCASERELRMIMSMLSAEQLSEIVSQLGLDRES